MGLVHSRRSLGRRLEGSAAWARFTPGTSFLHRLDPRTKMGALVVISGVSLIQDSLLPLLAALLFVLMLAGTSGLLQPLARAFWTFSPLLLFIVFIDMLFPKESTGMVYFSVDLGMLHPALSTGGFLFAAAMGVRLLTIAGFGVLFIMTTSCTSVIHALKALGVPDTLTFSLGYALRSTTALSTDFGHIMDAQRSRGLDFEQGSWVRKAEMLMALVIPMIIAVLNRARQVADAMQARGFGSGTRTTCYRPPHPGQRDLIMGVLLTGLAGFIAVYPRLSSG
jgi:energy-coupling factor transport system permease protein